MNLKFLFFLVLLCLSGFAIQGQERKVIVCDRQSDEKDYKRWLSRDVLYIITNIEKEIFLKLRTNEEREQFIKYFWHRRDPNPDTEENEFREEYYERIAYVNEHFSSGIPGWKTDRGLIYILFGKPDKIEKGRVDFEDLKNILFETWYYENINGMDSENKYTFIDPTESDEFRLPKSKRNEILNKSNSGLIICFMCSKM